MADDFFAWLGMPRRPWLDPEEVKERFHALSREHHPDQQASGSNAETDTVFARLNAAQAALRDPKSRLRCLLELEHPGIKVSGPAAVPETLADLFAPIHGLVGRIDALLAKKTAAPGALARALLAREEWSLQEEAQDTSRRAGRIARAGGGGVARIRRTLGTASAGRRRGATRVLPAVRVPLALDGPAT